MAVAVSEAAVDVDDSMTSDVASEQALAHNALLSFARCLGALEHEAVYLSAPITTGELFVAWRQANDSALERTDPEYPALHRAQVVAKNVARVVPLVAQLRRRFAERVVIDPTSLDDVGGWDQADYRDFWCEVIRRYAHTVVFADGWQYSHGCVAEFAAALRVPARLLTERLNPLTLDEGVGMVTAAADRLQGLGEDTVVLRATLESVRNHHGGS